MTGPGGLGGEVIDCGDQKQFKEVLLTWTFSDECNGNEEERLVHKETRYYRENNMRKGSMSVAGGAEAETPVSLEKEKKGGGKDWRNGVGQLTEGLGSWTEEFRIYSLGSGKSLKVFSKVVTCEDLQSPATIQA